MLILLFLPAALLLWKTTASRDIPDAAPVSAKFAWLSLLYFAVYFVVIFKVNILASSAGLWLSQFLVPLLLMRLLSEKPASAGFQWKYAFRDLKMVLAASALLLPLIFVVRDSSQLLEMARTVKFYIFLPVSVIFMLAIVAFWEEFFFRGIIMTALRRLTGSAAAAILLSALLFAAYHFPMRYLNPNSACHLDAAKALAEILNEHFIMGVFLGFAVHRTKNVWTGIWLHAFINGISAVSRTASWIRF